MTPIRLTMMLVGLALLTFWFVGRSQPASDLHARVPAATEPALPALVAPTPKALPVSNVRAVQAPAAAAPATGHSPSLQDLREFNDQLARLSACYEAECDYPQTDPRSYDFALGQDVKKTLFAMASFVHEQKLEQPEIGETARKYLESTDGHVQEAALALIATQPTSAENLQAILDHVLQGADSELIDRALVELQRYTAPTDLEKIHEGLAQAMLTGAPFVAHEVSTRISPFLNDESVAFFQELVGRLPEQSTYRSNLESSLSEFQRRKREG